MNQTPQATITSMAQTNMQAFRAELAAWATANIELLRGVVGPKGDKGDTGAKGDTGSSGARGAEGPAGVKGDTGTAGTAGTQGPKGDTGPAGPQGDKGDKGLTGNTGATGSQGFSGAAATVTPGSLTLLAAGATPTIQNSGSPSAAVLDFGLPRYIPTVTQYVGQGVGSLGVLAIGGTQTITVTLDETMPNTTFKTKIRALNGVNVLSMLSFTVLSRTATSVTLRATATGVASLAAVVTVDGHAITLT